MTADTFVAAEEEEEDTDSVVKVLPHILKQSDLLQIAPFVFPFVERVKFFQKLVIHDRTKEQGQYQDFLLGPSLSITVRRDHVYEDAFSELARGASKWVWRTHPMPAQLDVFCCDVCRSTQEASGDVHECPGPE